MEVSKKDWKLYREKLPKWQETYMEKLIVKYVEYLQSEEAASTKFWELEKRIKRDRKQELHFDLILLIREGVITIKDLDDFSDELKETVRFLLERLD